MFAREVAKTWTALFRPPVHAVRGVSFGCKLGETFGLLGVNGAGKTTTFEMLAGITTPSEGSIHIHGVDVHADTASARRLIGYCPQKDRIYLCFF